MASAVPPGSGGSSTSAGPGGASIGASPGASIGLGLQGTAVVVTGAGSGIGAAAARQLAASGAAVVLVGRRAEMLSQTASAVGRDGGSALCVPADRSDPASPALIIEAALAEFGRVDGLVNNAAVCRHFPLAGWDAAGFDEHWATNVRAPYFLIQAAQPALRRSPVKSVVNISSSSGTLRLSGQSVYGMTKSAPDYLTQPLAGELAPAGIRVNCIAPVPSIPRSMPPGPMISTRHTAGCGARSRSAGWCPSRNRAMDRAAAQPGVVIHDRRGDPAGRGPGDPACVRNREELGGSGEISTGRRCGTLDFRRTPAPGGLVLLQGRVDPGRDRQAPVDFQGVGGPAARPGQEGRPGS